MPTNMEYLINRLNRIEDLLLKLINSRVPSLDPPSFEAGLTDAYVGDLEEDQPYDDEMVEAYMDQIGEDDRTPRRTITFKNKDKNEATMLWDLLPDDMKTIIELSQSMREDYQLYESPSGQMRIMVSSEVESRFRSQKLGNRTDRNYPTK